MSHIIVTGSPGVGKSTLIRRLCDALRQACPNVRIAGFYTEEQRDPDGARVGFRVVSLRDGSSAQLAATPQSKGRTPSAAPSAFPTVGKYYVTVGQFESVALKELDNSSDCDVLVLDELGAMESKCARFCAQLDECLQRLSPSTTILATVPRVPPGRQPLWIVTKLMQRIPNAHPIELKITNRDAKLAQFQKALISRFTAASSDVFGD